ncbi:LysR family transcriptional regulator [uncultured Massilia sp.]|uniref:LysR family transcriptional regulator n=1 Tax=uncultured Massilia sp. TaxID=169973 RepID=UPI0025CF8BDB|nr:LysR family transcriptional regulator [uncultured Massilia sp.]
MDRLTSMAVFVKSVEAGSLSGAARQMGLSQAMVSKHLRSLEERVGARLLVLTTRRLALTEAGARYHQRCLQILGDVEDADLEAMQLQSVPKGLVRLAAPQTFGELHLAPALAQFLERYPEIVLEAEFDDRFADLLDRGFDLAVRIGRLPDSSLVARKLGESHMLTCAAPAYLARHGEPAHPSELARHRCLWIHSASTPGTWWYRDARGPLLVDVGGPLRSNSMTMACHAALRGLGLVFGPAFVLRPWVAAGRLTPVLAGFESDPLDIHAVYPGGRRVPAKVRLLIDFLAGWFEGRHDWNAPAPG